MVALVVLIVGGALGWFMRGPSAQGPASASGGSSIVDANFDSLVKVEKSKEGVSKIATGLVTGFPLLSLKSVQERNSVVEKFVAPNADKGLSDQMKAQLERVRTTFTGPAAAEVTPTAQVVIQPLTYKTDMTSSDKANVSVWYVTIFLDPTGSKVQSSWATANVSLAWSDHWRVVSYKDSGGPTPPLYAPDAKVSEYGDVVKVFSGHKAYRSAVTEK